MCFSLYFCQYLGIWCGGVGGSPNGLVYNLLVQFFTLYSSKMEISETYVLRHRGLSQ